LATKKNYTIGRSKQKRGVLKERGGGRVARGGGKKANHELKEEARSKTAGCKGAEGEM